jgi:hypothetical protein
MRLAASIALLLAALAAPTLGRLRAAPVRAPRVLALSGSATAAAGAPRLLASFLAFNTRFGGGVRVAVGDVNGDGVPDIIAASGPGAEPVVRIFDGRTRNVLRTFAAFDPAFRGGVFVAAGDLTGDGQVEIIAGAGPSQGRAIGPRVSVFDGATGQLLHSFLAFDREFTGGVRVAAGDVDGDGVADIITGAGPELGPTGPNPLGPAVRVFDGGEGTIKLDFLAYDASFRGGVFVAAGDLRGDRLADIITGPGAGSGPLVRVFDGRDGSRIGSFLAGSPDFRGGLVVAAGDINGDGRAEILTGAGPGGQPRVKIFRGAGGELLADFLALPPLFRGGTFVAAGDVDGDGRADILTGVGTGLPLVQLFAFTSSP